MNRTRRYCRTCDYNLAASGGPVCPECGRAFSPIDPRTFRADPRNSWRGRWRRWRWLIVPVVLLVAVWPRGWSATKITWTDSANTSSAEATALSIARPWWLGAKGGWFMPIVWGTTTGSPPVPPTGPDEHLGFTDDLWLCTSPWPWQYRMVGRGRLSIYGPPAEAALTRPQWRADIEAYVRTVARATGEASADAESMSIVAKATPWDTRVPPPKRLGPR